MTVMKPGQSVDVLVQPAIDSVGKYHPDFSLKIEHCLDGRIYLSLTDEENKPKYSFEINRHILGSLISDLIEVKDSL